jgi:hypothetical protein
MWLQHIYQPTTQPTGPPPPQAERPAAPLRVHQLSYEDSPEVTAFTAATEKEVGWVGGAAAD